MNAVAPGSLHVITYDAQVKPIPNTYEAIREAVGGTIEFVRVSESAGVYLPDEGVLHRLALNVPVSLYAGRGLYGNAVLCAAEPGDDGETIPPDERDVSWFHMVCERWNRVVVSILAGGTGDPYTYGNPDDLAPPMIFVGDDVDAFWKFMHGDNEGDNT